VLSNKLCFDLFLDRQQSHNAITAIIIPAIAPTAIPPMAPLLICEVEAAKFWSEPEVVITVLLPDMTVVMIIIELVGACDGKTPAPDVVDPALRVLDDNSDAGDVNDGLLAWALEVVGDAGAVVLDDEDEVGAVVEVLEDFICACADAQ